MSSVGYFSVNHDGTQESPVRRLMRLQEERVALAQALQAREAGVKRPERYEGVEEYDSVLRWHCRV